MAASWPPADALGYGERTWDQAPYLARGQISTAQRMPTAVLARGGPVAELPVGRPLALDALEFTDPLLGRPMSAQAFLDRRLFNDALLVWHRGELRHESYRNGIGPDDHHIAHSVTKTLTAMMVGIAQAEGRLDTNDPIARHVAPLAGIPAWDGVTVQHVLDMAVGIRTEEHYEDPASMYWRYAEAVGYYGASRPPGQGGLAFVVENLRERVAAPGSVFNYASYLTNLLPLALQSVYRRPAVDLYREHLVARLGLQSDVQFNLDPTGLPIVEGHANLCLRDLARWALLHLHEGRDLAGLSVVPAGFIRESQSPHPSRAAAFAASEAAAAFPGAQYHNKLWQLDPVNGRFAMLGIHGQFVYLEPAHELMIVGFGSFPRQTSPMMTACLRQLWSAIGRALLG